MKSGAMRKMGLYVLQRVFDFVEGLAAPGFVDEVDVGEGGEPGAGDVGEVEVGFDGLGVRR